MSSISVLPAQRSSARQGAYRASLMLRLLSPSELRSNLSHAGGDQRSSSVRAAMSRVKWHRFTERVLDVLVAQVNTRLAADLTDELRSTLVLMGVSPERMPSSGTDTSEEPSDQIQAVSAASTPNILAFAATPTKAVFDWIEMVVETEYAMERRVGPGIARTKYGHGSRTIRAVERFRAGQLPPRRFSTSLCRSARADFDVTIRSLTFDVTHRPLRA